MPNTEKNKHIEQSGIETERMKAENDTPIQTSGLESNSGSFNHRVDESDGIVRQVSFLVDGNE